MINKFFKNIHYTQKDKLIDEILYEQEMISRLHVSLGFAMTIIDFETILFEIDKHEKRLKSLQDDFKWIYVGRE